MSIVKRIQKAVNSEKEKQTPEVNHLNEYYEQIKKLGLVKKQQYNLPPLDTVGKRLYELYLVKEKEQPYN